MKKFNYIKIMLLCLFLILGMQKGYAQLGAGDVVTSGVASPSMAAMSQYSDVSVSMTTGLPDIGISLLSAPISDGSTSWPLSLSYNTRSTQGDEIASDVGNGWSFFGAGVIYKKVINYLDECYDNTALTSYKKNEFDDLYYYNLPGLSGKFKVKRDTINNTFSLINLTPNHAKIEYIRNSNTAIFKADSFTITADNGFKYFFDKTDLAKYDCGDLLTGKEFKTAYYLTKILNPIGVEVAIMNYDERKKYKGTSTTNLLFVQNKLKAITSRTGEVAFNYVYDDTLEPKKANDEAVSDPYSLQKITLKNPAGEELYSYVFNYTMISKGIEPSDKFRVLNSVLKNDKNGTLIEKNSFIYASPSGEGILKRVISPTGAVTEYNFESGDIFFNYNDPAYLAQLDGSTDITNPTIQYRSIMATAQVNTNQTLQYNFSVSGNPSVKKKFKFTLSIPDYSYPLPPQLPEIHEIPGFPPLPAKPRKDNLKITLKRGNDIIIQTFTIKEAFENKQFNLDDYPGNYTLELISTEGAVGMGNFSVSEVKIHPGPFRNAYSGGQSRIQNIKYYKNNSDTNAYRTVNYGYDSFEFSNSSSGYMFDNERDSEEDAAIQYTLYKSVKVSESGKGSIRYSFKTPDDYPKQQIGGTALEPQYFWPYYNITKSGLLSKKETYDEQNTLLSAELYDYELDQYSDNDYSFSGSYKITSKPAYVKKSMVNNKAFFSGGGLLETGSETWVSPTNLKPYYIKSFADGETSEQFLTYTNGLVGYNHLEAANMTGIPVIKEAKKNGKTISKSVTKYENTALLLPTSALAASISDGSMKQVMKIDSYDDKGNLVQLTSVAGLPTSFLYGYNKTQIIAKIEGARYDDIKNNPLLITAITASNDDNVNPASESVLITALDNLRKDSSMAEYQITAYTYNPLIGLTTTTTPNGQREVYEYDGAGRLKTVKKMEKDVSGNVIYKKLREYQYNYKQ
ncbi:RHS repeat protein [Sphingobacterium sp. SRCM116780]|uniref:RHS repeat domain-containing protein n=1 Tax=Sphingobacterium sp. SRCM116780 TaxID=2907623 RepID=UPI001F46A355|nr:RHS repeat domain-containing protein [Sphingobacterium sp. SRCM116780]UIR57825.1 RHS repeat protein [Sphingobacterium sp. SRCM116780]